MSNLVNLASLRTTAQVASELQISARRVRQVASQMEIGYLAGRSFLFTPEDVEKLRKRRTDRAPIRSYLRERAQTRREETIKRVIDRVVTRATDGHAWDKKELQ